MPLLGHDTFIQGATQSLALGAASVSSAAFGAQTRWIRVCVIGTAGGGCHIQVGEAAGVTATATSSSLPTNWIEYISVNPGQKIAVIQDAATTGNLIITELA